MDQDLKDDFHEFYAAKREEEITPTAGTGGEEFLDGENQTEMMRLISDLYTSMFERKKDFELLCNRLKFSEKTSTPSLSSDKFIEQLSSREEERVTSEDQIVSELKWFKLTVIKPHVEKTGKKILNLIIESRDEIQKSLAPTEGISTNIHVSDVMNRRESLGNDFLMCVNNNNQSNASIFRPTHPLTKKTTQDILNSYLVDNASSFAICEFLETCLEYSRETIEDKKFLFSQIGSQERFFTDIAASKRKAKIKVIPQKVKDMMSGNQALAYEQAMPPPVEDGSLQVKIPSVPTEEDQEAQRIFKMLLIHNVKTFGNRNDYHLNQEAKEKGEAPPKEKKKEIKKKKEKAKAKSRFSDVHRFGGKGKKKKGADVDVCIVMKGEDGAINEIVVEGKKKKKKGKKALKPKEESKSTGDASSMDEGEETLQMLKDAVGEKEIEAVSSLEE